jgi:uncharacterized protein
VSPAHVLLLLVAGVGAGVCGTVAGLASLSSYPALLAVGLSPVAANATNTVALIGNTLGSVVGSRPELADQGPRVRHWAPLMLAGGIVGGVLLLTTPGGGFERAVPFLVAFAAVMILVRPWLQRTLDRRRAGREPRRRWWHEVPLFAAGVYGGYFGAGAGVMVLALLMLATRDTVVRSNALKNVLLGLANGAAAVTFALFGPVDWAGVVPLVAGCLLGGYAGPSIARIVPPTALRWVIALAGLYLAVRLGLDAWQ